MLSTNRKKSFAQKRFKISRNGTICKKLQKSVKHYMACDFMGTRTPTHSIRLNYKTLLGSSMRTVVPMLGRELRSMVPPNFVTTSFAKNNPSPGPE